MAKDMPQCCDYSHDAVQLLACCVASAESLEHACVWAYAPGEMAPASLSCTSPM